MIEHRGQQIRKALENRRASRRSRRARHKRYRPARFSNRRRAKGWLAPSLMSRVDNIWTWVCRLSRVCPIDSISQELVRFDMQLMENAEISGVEYVKAVVSRGKYAGIHTGRVACRATGSFDITTPVKKVTVNHKNCRVLHHADDYTTQERSNRHSSAA